MRTMKQILKDDTIDSKFGDLTLIEFIQKAFITPGAMSEEQRITWTKAFKANGLEIPELRS
jgi:hypothetical protein